MSSGLSSMSLERAPGPNKSFVRGKSGISHSGLRFNDVVVDSKDENNQNKTSKGMRTVPPGFTRGLHFLRARKMRTIL